MINAVIVEYCDVRPYGLYIYMLLPKLPAEEAMTMFKVPTYLCAYICSFSSFIKNIYFQLLITNVSMQKLF